METEYKQAELFGGQDKEAELLHLQKLDQIAEMPRQATTFADARLLAGHFKGKPLENRGGLIAVLSRNNLDKMLSESAVSKSTSATEHALAVANLDHLFKNATYGWAKDDRAGDRNIPRIHRLFAPMDTATGIKIVKLTVKELSHDNQQNKIYTVEATKVEIESSTSIWVNASLRRDGLDPKSTPYAELVRILADAVQKHNEAHVKKMPREAQREYLVVPFAEKNAAKAAGAKWDGRARAWYAPESADRERLKTWLPENRQHRYVSPESEFREAMQSIGLEVSASDPVSDGKSHRVRADGDKGAEKAGYYTFHIDGAVPAGYIKNFRTGEEVRWRSQGTLLLNAEERARLKAELATKKAEREQERRATQDEAAQRVQAKAGKLLPVESSTPYLTAKGIKAHAGILTDQAGKTHIPAYDVDGKQWTMQTISKDGVKRFERGGRKEGCFHVVGGQEKLKDSDVILISEGYATAASVSEATGRPAVAAFDAGNLKAVALALRERYPEKTILICGDDDRHNEKNPGRVKAEAAALAVNGKAVFPTFAPEENTKAFTDFNDLNKSALGKAAISQQIEHAIQIAVHDEKIDLEEAKQMVKQTDIGDYEQQILDAAHDSNVEYMRTAEPEQARAYAERDIESLNLEQDQEEAWKRKIAAIKDYAEANPHYRATINELSPDLLRERSQQQAGAQAQRPDAEKEELEDLRARARSEADVLETPEDTQSELLEIDDLDKRGHEFNYQPGKTELEELRARTPGATPEDSRSEILDTERKQEAAKHVKAKEEQEQREYMTGLNDNDDGIELSNRTGSELENDDFIVPRSIAQKYVEIDGKYYTKDTQNPRVMFEDKGNQLRTSTTDRNAIADMVKLAKAKQWESLKLSGSREFRREAWLQAESQGIKTSGYTPKAADLAALEVMRQERSTNTIQPLQERRAERAGTGANAPRHDLNKNQAQIHVSATERVAENVEALKRNPAFANRSQEELEKLAYYRGIAQENVKREPKAARDAALAKFDTAAENPAFLERLEKSDAQAKQTTKEREVQQKERKDTPEQSL
jgi:phage/plasmid primase-like uncharacterized protein